MIRRHFLELIGLGGLSAFSVSGKSPTGGSPASAMVQTLTGPISPDRFGTTLIHEHLLYGTIPVSLRQRSVDIVLNNLREAARVGIDTIMCLSPERDISLYAQIAEQSPGRLIASTGNYIYNRSSPSLQKMSEAEMVTRMVRDLNDGIDGTKFRAGVIKATGQKSPLTEWEKTCFRAAGRAQKETGVPVCTHAIYAPRDQFDILVAAGANPEKCYFSHTEAEFGWQGRNLEQQTAYLLDIAKAGGSMLFNNFGLYKDTPWDHLVYIIKTLCDKGYMHRVLISVDSAWEWVDGKPAIQHADRYPGDPARTYSYMMTEAVPALLRAGFSAQDIKTFLVDNPRRMFGGNP
jgi:phosphotriesterase-related protein